VILFWFTQIKHSKAFKSPCTAGGTRRHVIFSITPSSSRQQIHLKVHGLTTSNAFVTVATSPAYPALSAQHSSAPEGNPDFASAAAAAAAVAAPTAALSLLPCLPQRPQQQQHPLQALLLLEDLRC
jgi:hypothetical protein